MICGCHREGYGPDTDRLHLWAAMHDQPPERPRTMPDRLWLGCGMVLALAVCAAAAALVVLGAAAAVERLLSP